MYEFYSFFVLLQIVSLLSLMPHVAGNGIHRIQIQQGGIRDLSKYQESPSNFNSQNLQEGHLRTLSPNDSPSRSELLSRLRKHNRYQQYQNISTLKNSTEIINSTSISLERLFGNTYNIEIFVGSDNESFKMKLDTCSSYIWITNSSCNSCQQAGISKSFDCEKSKTCKNKNEEIYIKQGKVKGTLITDSIGLDSLSQIKIFDQDILLVTSMKDLNNVHEQGQIGLGFSELDGDGDDYQIVEDRNTLIDNLWEQKRINKKIFALSLSRNIKNNTDYFIIGGDAIDSALASIEEKFTCDVKAYPYWGVTVAQIMPIIQEIQMDIHIQNQIAILDTGYPFIGFPKEDFEIITKFFLKLKNLDCDLDTNLQLIKCNCTDTSVYPSFRISICSLSSRPIIISPSLYLTCDSKMCIASFSRVTLGEPDKQYIVLGDVFIRSQYILFNEEQKTISFFKQMLDSDDLD